MNENKRTYQNWWDISLNACIRKEDKTQINNLSSQSKILEENKWILNRSNEIKGRAEN